MTENIAEVTIRPAVLSDAPGIAAVHVKAWQHAYAGIVPADHLAALDVDVYTDRWDSTLTNARADNLIAIVAVTADGVVGFIVGGPTRDDDARMTDREVYSMYLEPSAWGHGVARELMRTFLDEVPATVGVTLWVLADNERARHFYRRHGFQLDSAERTVDIGGAPLVKVRYRRG